MAGERFNEIREKMMNVRGGLDNIANNPWPQTQINPEFSKTRGFLPPVLINPTIGLLDEEGNSALLKIGDYEYEDWIGQKITPNGLIELDTKDKFNESLNLPKDKQNLDKDPYSTRDHYLIFGDTSTDYFKHGLQIIDGLNPVGNSDGDGDLRLSQFKSTPFENNDPVIFGFEVIIDDVSSPLLNGSVLDFLNNYKSIKEIGSKIPVYEDFKNQIIKFFKTTTSVTLDSIDFNKTALTKTSSEKSEVGKNRGIYQRGSQAYMSYYLQKISGLWNLIESNKPGTFKYLADYRKDVITLEFMEDVSLSLGTLSHLYKLLYWSKPNGKSLVPENLLRFNCSIIVSECRNFNRVRKAVETGNLEVIKDNLSRHVYSLRECQMFFDKPAHNDDIDMGNIGIYGNTSVVFDYKYSTVKFERFVPSGDFGQYKGYDSGAIWKIGNPGVRNGTQSLNFDISVPKFFTEGMNEQRQNGVESPFIVDSIKTRLIDDENGDVNNDITTDPGEGDLEDLKASSKSKSKSYAKKLMNRTVDTAKKELQTAINIRTQLLTRTINKAFISLQGGTIRPPTNVYTSSKEGTFGRVSDSIFYDVRGDLVGFLGGALGGAVGGGFSGDGKNG